MKTVLGMRVGDTVTGFMTFLRCNPNHHSLGFIALPRRGRHHAAFDFQGADLREGFKAIEKGVGPVKSERARTRLALTRVLGRF